MASVADIRSLMKFEKNKSLKQYNTFGIDVKAEKFCAFQSTEELAEAVSELNGEKLFILGGGSNILLTRDVEGVVLRNEILGIEVIQEDEQHYLVKAGGGVVWHEFVMDCVDKERAGVENLSLIPGSVGAAPMQNIGAYGVEIKEVFHELEAFHLPSGEIHRFGLKECQFGYRESVFKRALKGEYAITSVTFRLDREATFHTSYGAIQSELDRMQVEDLSIKAISEAVIAIRRSKLPDPAEIGNSGSFFKNPVIPQGDFDALVAEHPDMPNYPAGEGMRKVAAGWLIDQAGWKGKDFGNYGVHDKQALVLVNRGGASGQEIYDLSSDIIDSIKDRFGIKLEREVNII